MKALAVYRDQKGVAVLEALVSLGVLGLVATVFISGLATTAKADLIINEQTVAQSVARSQIDYIKGQGYIDFSQVGHGNYAMTSAPTGYTVGVSIIPIDPATGQALPTDQDNGVQKVAVTISHQSRALVTLESYKVNR